MKTDIQETETSEIKLVSSFADSSNRPSNVRKLIQDMLGGFYTKAQRGLDYKLPDVLFFQWLFWSLKPTPLCTLSRC